MTSNPLLAFFQAFLAFLVAFFGAGCGPFNTGPRLTKETTQVIKAMVAQAADGLRGQSGQMSAQANINDPDYEIQVLVGPVWLVNVTMGLTGVDLHGSFQASLIERLETDEDLRERLFLLLNDVSMTEEAKREAFEDFLREALNKVVP